MEINKRKLTIHIIIGMVAGMILGTVINLTGNEGWISESLVNGFFDAVGQIFIRLLTVLVVPLVFVSLVCGAAALDDIRKVGRVGLMTMGLYLLTTAGAITLAMVAAVIVRPGAGFDLQTDLTFAASDMPSLKETLIDIFPRNVVQSMAEGNMLPIIVFAILLGLALVISGEPGKRIYKVFQDLNEVVMKLVFMIMLVAPYGVFALVTRTFANEGFSAIAPLGKYFGLVIVVLLIHGTVTYSTLLKVFAKLNPVQFFKNARTVHLFAFSTASSNATLPISINVAENRMGVKNSVASFVLPLGATINMDGTAIMQGVATVFISQAYGIPMGFSAFLMVIVTATLASIGTAGVPGVGMIMLTLVLRQVGLPVEGIALIIGIDRILDMVRTAVNVTGDLVVSCIVGKFENQFDEKIYYAENPAGED